MGSRMFILLVLVLLILTDHSQGVPETDEQSLIVSTLTKASAAGEALTTQSINTPRQLNRLCNCKGKKREMVDTQCLCQRSIRRKPGKKWRKRCPKTKNKNLKKCSWFSKPKKDGNIRRVKTPSVPI